MMVTASPAAAHGHPAVGGGQTSSSYLAAQYDYAAHGVDDDQTLRNTIANTHIPSSPFPGTTGTTPATSTTQPLSSTPYSFVDSTQHYGTTPAVPRSGVSASLAVAPGGSRFAEDWDATRRGSPQIESPGAAGTAGAVGAVGVSGTAGTATTGLGSGSNSIDGGASLQPPTRTNTLKKRSSVRRSTSLHRSSSLHRNGSRRSVIAGSVRSLALQTYSDLDESHSAFYCPVPTKGSPTDALANRFQAWRKILKDLIAYHREIQNHYEQRAKSVQKLAASLNAATLPPGFIVSGGLDDATQVLRNFHKQAVVEATKARELEDDVILALTGLRSDLNQKIKEIKNISGDFRNSVDKEMDATKKAVKALQDVLGQAELDAALTTGRQDPYLLRLAVDRQLDRQLQEENYLHQAYLNIEKSGRELESIVVGEIQKSYNAYAGILKREAGLAYATVDELRAGPVAMPKDEEWMAFIQDNEQFVDPEVPVRSFDQIHYPGQDHDACQEIRAGLLERKSKYLKSYTAGWYVLSPTHLHEFKSADKMQAPVMSLYLPEQKLGSHSNQLAKSSKFVLKGRQTGAMHRGHTWVFRAESYDTMMAWYEDIQALTERTPQERNELAHARGSMRHSRSVSRASQHTYSSDGFVNEDDDDEPFAMGVHGGIAPRATVGDNQNVPQSGYVGTNAATAGQQIYQAQQQQPQQSQQPLQSQQQQPQAQSQPAQQSRAAPSIARRPSPGGRFPSDLLVNAQRGLELQAAGAIPMSPSSATGSGASGPGSDYAIIAAASGLPGSHTTPNVSQHQPKYQQQQQQQQELKQEYEHVNGYTVIKTVYSPKQRTDETNQFNSVASQGPVPAAKSPVAGANGNSNVRQSPVTQKREVMTTRTRQADDQSCPATPTAQTPSSGTFHIPGGFPRTSTAEMN